MAISMFTSLPGVRDELVAALSDRYGAAASRVRLGHAGAAAGAESKAAMIAATGARGLMRLARAHGHAVNSDFAGRLRFFAHGSISRRSGGAG